MSYVFWDTETTGLDKAFHQPVEIGGVVTDTSLNSINQFEILCRPSQFVLPDPGALAVTGRSIAELLQRPVSIYEATGRFVDEMRRVPGMCSVTYNGITFDDPLMEHTLYRNLRDPYFLKKTGGRIDVLKLVHVAHALRPDALVVPTSVINQPVFKLDALAPANGFGERGAHSACVDARATLHLVRQIAGRVPTLWEHAAQTWSRKTAVREFLHRNEVVVEFVWNARSRSPQFKILVPVDSRPNYAGEYMCLDAGISPLDYQSLSPEDLVEHITRGTVPRAICPIRLNKMPIVFAIEDPLIANHLPSNLPELIARIRPLISDLEFCDRMMEAADLRQAQYPTAVHVEQQLYSGGFMSEADAARLAQFHQVDSTLKMQVIDTLNDPRLRELATRVVFEEWPNVLPTTALNEIAGQVSARHHAADTSPWTTIGGALRDIDKRLQSADKKTRSILLEYRQYLIDLSRLSGAAE